MVQGQEGGKEGEHRGRKEKGEEGDRRGPGVYPQIFLRIACEVSMSCVTYLLIIIDNI